MPVEHLLNTCVDSSALSLVWNVCLCLLSITLIKPCVPMSLDVCDFALMEQPFYKCCRVISRDISANTRAASEWSCIVSYESLVTIKVWTCIHMPPVMASTRSWWWSKRSILGLAIQYTYMWLFCCTAQYSLLVTIPFSFLERVGEATSNADWQLMYLKITHMHMFTHMHITTHTHNSSTHFKSSLPIQFKQDFTLKNVCQLELTLRNKFWRQKC